jgi:hypothetical protein
MSNGSFPQAGFYYQNNVALLQILGLLEIGSDIISIHLENFSKGKHIDDIIITRRDKTEYFQVKWAEDSTESYTINNLITSADEEDKSLWKKLARGYSSIQNPNSGDEIILFSNRRAGSSILKSKGITKSLADLIRFQKAFKASDHTDLKDAQDYQQFKDLINTLSEVSELNETSFCDFFKKLRFELGAPENEYIERQIENKYNKLGLEFSQKGTLLEAVIKWSISGEGINKKILLQKLGVNDRFTDRLSHVFKIDESTYLSNDLLFEKLDRAIEAHDNGYIFLQGVPGSGKSTLLTKYLAHSKAVLFAYYCFIPGDFSTKDQRLKAEYFLKSLCISIENAFPTIEFPKLYSDNYEDKLSLYLEELSQRKEKIVFIIDGLDHVDRAKEMLNHPLTNNLLSALPPNILIIISSQYVDALPTEVKLSIQAEPSRYLEMNRFSEPQVNAYLNSKGLIVDSGLVRSVFQKSEGIPLYLYYICAKLSESDVEEYSKIIDEFPVLIEGEINTYHLRLYEDIRNNSSAVWILTILANRKEYTSVSIMDNILQMSGHLIDRVTITQILVKYKHLLKEKDGNSYTVFHNSFREFILSQTRNLTEPLNEALINYYGKNIYEEESFRNYFTHLFALGKFEIIISSVSDEWITQAWKNYRTLDEIDNNLDIAWKSCIEISSLREFIRIAFLKHQLGASIFTLDNSEFENSLFFLEANFNKESLRAIWDGEFPVISNYSFFNHYCIEYFKKTGTLIPTSVAKVFFDGFLNQTEQINENDRNEPDFTTYLKAVALYLSPVQLLDEIVEYQSNLEVEDLKSLVSFLRDFNKAGHLRELWDKATDQAFKNFVLSNLIATLLKKDQAEAAKFSPTFSFETLNPQQKIEFIIQISPYTDYSHIKSNYNNVEIDPLIDNNIIVDSFGYKLNQRFLSLYDELRIKYLLDSTYYSIYELRLSDLNAFIKPYYLAISSAAKLWADTKRVGAHLPETSQRIKEIIDILNIPTHIVSRFISGHGLPSFIRFEIYRIYGIIFKMVAEVADSTDISAIIPYWLLKHKDSNGIVHFRNNLEFVEAVKLIADKDMLAELLKQAEDIARSDKGTSTLVDNLTAVGRKYGMTGFVEDYNRIYTELLAISCGVSYRKDFQFASIFRVLEEVDKLDSQDTLQKLADCYSLLYKVKEAGDNRMFHVSMSILIEFAMKHFPGLGFLLMIKEELNLERDEALRIVFTDIISNCKDDELPFLWAIVTTVGKWENFDKDDDDEIAALYSAFFQRMTSSANTGLLEQSYKYVYRQFLVEQHRPTKIYKVNKILETSGKPYSFIQTPEIIKKESNQNPQIPLPQHIDPPVKLNFSLRVKKLTKEELIELPKAGADSIRNYLREYVRSIEYNNTVAGWKEFYKLVLTKMRVWASALSPEKKMILKSGYPKAARFYRAFKFNVAASKRRDKAFFTEELKSLLANMDQLMPDLGFSTTFKEQFQSESAEFEMSRIFNKWNSKTYGAITDDEILWIADNTDAEYVKDWVPIVLQYFAKQNLVTALTRLSKKSFVYNEEYGKELARMAFRELENLSYRSGDPDIELLEWAYECLPDMANRFVLQSFYTGHIEHAYEIPYHIEKKIVPFLSHFNEPDFYRSYFDANYAYNMKLAEGLQDPQIDSSFISSFKNTEDFKVLVCDYLVNLFDHPVIKTRQLAIGALYELYKTNPVILENFTRNDLKGLTSNQIEHLIVLFRCIAIEFPESIGQIAQKLDGFFSSGHFNIQQTFAELILDLTNRAVIKSEELELRASKINQAPIFPTPPIIRPLKQEHRYAMSPYQAYLISTIAEKKNSAVNFGKELYTVLIEDGFDPSKAQAQESAIHRHYNINNAFDSLEINGSAYSKINDLINRLFVKNINEGSFSNRDIEAIKYDFRLYDPSDQLALRAQRPPYIFWKGKSADEAAFMNFSDIDEVLEDFFGRDPSLITVFENGYQRIDNYPSHFTTHFDVAAFMIPEGTKTEKLEEIFQTYLPYFRHDNLYRTELNSFFESPYDKIGGIISPILCGSTKHFRYKLEDTLATILPQIQKDLRISIDPVTLSSDPSSGNSVVNFIEWQDEFLPHDRRRFEPNSQGAVLNIDKKVIMKYVQERKLQLFLFGSFRRSIDKFITESEMNWNDRIIIKPYPI